MSLPRRSFRACCSLAVLAGCASQAGGGGGFDRRAAMAQCEQRRASAPTAGTDDCARRVDAQAQEAALLGDVEGPDAGSGGGRSSNGATGGRHGGGRFGMETGFGHGTGLGGSGPGAAGSGGSATGGSIP